MRLAELFRLVLTNLLENRFKAVLTSLGIQGEYEGIGHCILGYPEGELPQPAPRKENWIYRI